MRNFISGAVTAVITMILVVDSLAQQVADPKPARAGFSAERLTRIDDFFASEIANNRVPGGVIGIARNGEIVYLKAFGYRDKDKGLPMQVDSIFALASMTKPMVAAGILP